MRTEAEIRAMLARLIDEYERATAEMRVDPVHVAEVRTAAYQITIRQTAMNIAQSINILRWALGELDIPYADQPE